MNNKRLASESLISAKKRFFKILPVIRFCHTTAEMDFTGNKGVRFFYDFKTFRIIQTNFFPILVHCTCGKPCGTMTLEPVRHENAMLEKMALNCESRPLPPPPPLP